MKQIKIPDQADILLAELSAARKRKEHLNSSKQGIIAELVMNEHKRVIGSEEESK